MKKTRQTLRYLNKSSLTGLFVGFIIILINVAITDLVFYFTDRQNTVHQVVPLTVPFVVITGLIVFVMGISLFKATFKVSLANGVSRKTFLLSNIPAAAVTAAAFSIFNFIVIKVHGLFWPIISLLDFIYKKISSVEFLILQFAIYFLLIIIGRFITLAYYRSSTIVKWVITILPFATIYLLQVANARSGGSIFRVMNEYFIWSREFPRNIPLLLAYAAVLYGLAYLLIRRAPLKD